MQVQLIRYCPPKVGTAATVVLTALLLACPVAGYTPESPEVIAAVERAIKFLERAPADANGLKPGGKALVGLALLKHTATLNDPEAVGQRDVRNRHRSRRPRVVEPVPGAFELRSRFPAVSHPGPLYANAAPWP